jgi:hypothetical protein
VFVRMFRRAVRSRSKYRLLNMATPGGLEPPTNSLEVRISEQKHERLQRQLQIPLMQKPLKKHKFCNSPDGLKSMTIVLSI